MLEAIRIYKSHLESGYYDNVLIEIKPARMIRGHIGHLSGKLNTQGIIFRLNEINLNIKKKKFTTFLNSIKVASSI